MRRLITTLTITLTVLVGCSTAAAQPAPPASKPDASSVTRQPARPTDAEVAAWKAEVAAQQRRAAADAAWRAAVTAYADALWRARVHAYWQATHYPHGLCGGDLPPCWVMMRESRGDIHAQNPRSTASGKWQFLDSTWAGYGGYRKARYAPEQVQDAKARQVWAGGRGCSHWSAC